MVSADLFSTTRLGTQLPNTMASSPRLTSMPFAASADERSKNQTNVQSRYAYA